MLLMSKCTFFSYHTNESSLNNEAWDLGNPFYKLVYISIFNFVVRNK